MPLTISPRTPINKHVVICRYLSTFLDIAILITEYIRKFPTDVHMYNEWYTTNYLQLEHPPLDHIIEEKNGV